MFVKVIRDFLVPFILFLSAFSAAMAQGDQWVSINGPAESQIRNLQFLPTGELIAELSVRGGIYRSYDTGKTWSWWRTQTGKVILYATSDPSTGTYYAVRDSNRLPAQLMKSTDGGTQWTDIPNPLGLTRIYFIEVNTVTGTLYTSGTNEKNEYLTAWSSDNGISWQALDSATLSAGTSVVNPISGNIITSAPNNQVQRLHPENMTQTNITPDSTVSLLLIIPGNGERIFAQANLRTGLPAQIFLTEDDGNTWTKLPPVQFDSTLIFLGENSRGDLFMSLHWGGLLRSTDNGLTWSKYSDFRSFVQKSVFLKDGSMLVGSTNGVYHIPYSGENITSINKGIVSGTTDAMFPLSNGDIVCIPFPNYLGTFHYWNENNRQWTFHSTGATAPPASMVALPNGTWLAGYEQGVPVEKRRRVYRSTEGEIWEPNEEPLPGNTSMIRQFYYALNGTIYGSTLTTTLKSTDDGRSWEDAQLDGRASSIMQTSNGRMFVTLSGLDGQSKFPMRVSDDTGRSWRELHFPDTLTAGFSYVTAISNTELIGSLRPSPFSTRTELLHLSIQDTTVTWTILSSPDTLVSKTVFSNTGTLYALSYSNLYRSNDTGKTWTTLGPEHGLPKEASLIEIVKTDQGKIFLATYSQGVFMLDNNVTGIEQTENIATTTSRIVPNPFNSITMVEFTLPTAQTLQIDVTDVQGRLIAILAANRRYSPGQHSILWNPSELSSGTYFIRIHGATFNETLRVFYQ